MAGKSHLGIPDLILQAIEKKKAGRPTRPGKSRAGALAKCLKIYQRIYRLNLEMIESAADPDGLREIARARLPTEASPSPEWDAIADVVAGRREREEANPAWLETG